MKRITILSLSILLILQAVISYSQANENHPLIEVVFTLDTTGSMSGLIDGAKNNIWSIINTLSSADPLPNIRVGLVAYRDKGDAYITQLTHLSGDIDGIYTSLMQFQAQGGGDGPESVNQGLYEAVMDMDWSEDPDAYQVVFLVGDYPPHMDYPDDVHYQRTCEIAREKGIIINTILCGNNQETLQYWQDISNRTKGDFFQVAQSGGNVAINTPYDKEIAELSNLLERTRYFYGSPDEITDVYESLEKVEMMKQKAAPAAMAQRAEFNISEAGKTNFIAHQELINDFYEHPDSVSRVNKEWLPQELREFSDSDLVKFITITKVKRDKITSDMQVLIEIRQAYIQDKLSESEKTSSFEYNLFETVKTQTKNKSLEFLNNEARY